MLTGKNIITRLQKEILAAFASLPDSKRFYLAGGTALSEFYLAHRKSYDLDIFTSEQGLIFPFSHALENQLGKNFNVKMSRRFETFAEFEISNDNDTTKIQLALDSPFHFKPQVDSDIGIKIISYKDLITDKILAYFGRATPRDAVDLFFILKKENAAELLKLAKEKDPGFDLYWMAVALEKVRDLPDDIDEWPVQMLVPVNVAELKTLFLEWSQKNFSESLKK